jgi:dipeptidyl aminopeptidase/acylaminoacyl peptidase
MPEAAWRRRFRATRATLPRWARDQPERLLYVSNAGGKFELYAWDRQAGTHRQVTDRAEGTTTGAPTPDGAFVWWFDDRKGDEFGTWVRQPFGGGPDEPAAPGVPAAYGAGLSLARGFAVVGGSDDGGTSVFVAGPDRDPVLLYRHAEDASVGGLSRDESLVALSHSEHGDGRHRALRILTVDGETVADLWDGPGLGLYPSGWSPVPGDERLLVIHERRDLPRPIVWSPATGEVLEPELDLPGEVDASWYPDARSLLIAHDHEGRSELHRLDLETGRLEPVWTEPGTVLDARVRPDGEPWFSFTRSSSPAVIRSPGATVLEPPGEPPPEGVAYTAHRPGGVPVFVAEPPGPGPHPTILIVHGGPEAHDRDAFSPYAQAWVDHGFAVVLVNYRGSTGYGRAWRDANEGNPGLTELADLAVVRDWLADEARFDPSRIVLSGASWGGYLTLLGLGVQPERWSLGIAAVPVADYPAAYEDEMESLKAVDRALFGGTPEEVPEVYRERSPITYVDQVRVPVLVLAGENDPRCPIRQIENYLACLRELGKEHDVYRFDAGHGSLVIEETIRQLEVELAFAAGHLGTSPPQP